MVLGHDLVNVNSGHGTGLTIPRDALQVRIHVRVLVSRVDSGSRTIALVGSTDQWFMIDFV
jgi:hypothetical protein